MKQNNSMKYIQEFLICFIIVYVQFKYLNPHEDKVLFTALSFLVVFRFSNLFIAMKKEEEEETADN